MKDYYSRIDERIKKQKKFKNSEMEEKLISESVNNTNTNTRSRSRKKTSYHPIEYPIVLKAYQGHLIFSMPDFMISHVIPLPTTGFDAKYLHNVAKSIAKTWLMAKERVETLKTYGAKVPEPTLIKDVLKRHGKRKLSVAEVAVLLGKSQMTVRRMADRADLPCTKSSGGHREFLFKDILKILNM